MAATDGQQLNPARKAVMRFLVYLENERRASANTVAAYRRDLGQLIAYVEEKRGESLNLEDIDVLALRGFLGQLARTHKASSIARKIAAARSWFRYLMRTRLVRRNPAAELSTPKLTRPLPAFLNAETMNEVIEASAGESVTQLRDAAVLETLYGGGLRVSELRGLNVDSMEMRDDRPSVRVIGKGNKERVVPLGSYALEALQRYLARREELLRRKSSSDAHRALFLSTRGSRLSVRSVQKLVKRYGVLGAGRADLHPHALRHTCATHLLDGGADLRAIQELLGHTSLSVTQRYTHTSIEGLLKVYDKAHPLASGGLAADRGDRKPSQPK